MAPKSTSIFTLGVQISSFYTSLSLIIVIFCAILFELITHRVSIALKDKPSYLAMVNKLYSELMILGFISFIVFMLIHTESVQHSKFLYSFEFAHIVIFFVALGLIMHGVCFAFLSHWATIVYSQAADIYLDIPKQTELSEKLRKFLRKSSCIFQFMPWCLKMHHKTLFDAQFVALHDLFIKSHGLPQDFDFKLYIRDTLQSGTFSCVNIETSSWLLVMIGLGFNVLRILAVSGGKGDDGTTMSTDPESNIQNFMLGAYILFFYACFVYYLICNAHGKLLKKAGCSTLEKLVTRMEEIREDHQEAIHSNEKSYSWMKLINTVTKPLNPLSESGKSVKQTGSGADSSIIAIKPTKNMPSLSRVRSSLLRRMRVQPKDRSNYAARSSNNRTNQKDQAKVSPQLSDEMIDAAKRSKRASTDFFTKDELNPKSLRLTEIFFLKSQYTFRKMMEILVVMNCFALALFASWFVNLTLTHGDNAESRIMITALPLFVIMTVLCPTVSRNYSFLSSIVKIDVDSLERVLQSNVKYQRTKVVKDMYSGLKSMGISRGSIEVVFHALETEMDIMYGGQAAKKSLLLRLKHDLKHVPRDDDTNPLDSPKRVQQIEVVSANKNGNVGRVRIGKRANIMDVTTKGKQMASPSLGAHEQGEAEHLANSQGVDGGEVPSDNRTVTNRIKLTPLSHDSNLLPSVHSSSQLGELTRQSPKRL